MEILPVELGDLEERWAAYNARSLVSHAEHFTVARNASLAFACPSKPLSDLRVALLSSGGVYLKTSAGFDMESHAGDDSIRWISGDAETRDLRFAHDHYDHTDADRDPNCMFPLNRLRELAAGAIIGSVAAQHVGMMGFIPDPSRLIQLRAPEIIARLAHDGVDAVVLSPG